MTQRTVTLRSFLAAIIGLSVVFALVVIAIVQIDQRNDREDEQEELDINYLNCLRGNEYRRASIKAEQARGAPLDLTPTLDGSEPEWFRHYVERLAAFSRAAAERPIDPKSRTGQAIAVYESQIRDCETEWAGHTPGIRLRHSP